ncbi:hypothetical protein KUIN1_36880 [Pseudomonas sp. KUIN-1]|nr:hypothetical protein KUIN1_36880 [Pseudomonas sp. KUIN-1]
MAVTHTARPSLRIQLNREAGNTARHHDRAKLCGRASTCICGCVNTLGISRNRIHGSLCQCNILTDNPGHCSMLRFGVQSSNGTCPSRNAGTTSWVIHCRNPRFSA